jgi:hypothetical protein
MGDPVLWNSGENVEWNTGEDVEWNAGTNSQWVESDNGNVVFMADNMLDRAAALTASSEAASLPVTNLQDHQRTNVWRTNGNPGQASVDITLAPGEPGVSGIAVVDHNLSLAGSIRVQAWTDSINGANVVVDETIQPYSPVAAFGDGLFGDGLFGGYEAVGPFSSYSARSLLRVVSFIHSSVAVGALYWRVTLIDTVPDYLQCGRIFIGEVWQPVVNHSWGSKLNRVSQTSKRESRGGQLYSNPRPGRMVMEFGLDWLQLNDQQRLWATFLYVETDTPIIVIQKPASDTFDRELRSLYCTFDELSVEAAFHSNHRSPIRLIEAL